MNGWMDERSWSSGEIKLAGGTRNTQIKASLRIRSVEDTALKRQNNNASIA
jgi:hypothetical protein